ncbi:MAG: hypothetical protein WBW04_04780 [Nitrolancea sp.]
MKPIKRVYLDTNVFRFIERCDEATAVREFLDSNGLRVTANDHHLTETYAIRDDDLREQAMKTITEVATNFARVPDTFLHADELLAEVRRCRPRGLCRRAEEASLIPIHLKNHRMKWKEAKAQPRYVPSSFQTYKHDSDAGKKHFTIHQKVLRSARLHDESVALVSAGGSSFDLVTTGYETDEEKYWRTSSLSVWSNALVLRLPASRDYADWVAPYVDTRLLREPDYSRFWLHEVKARNMPRNHITCLAEFFQLDHKIDAGGNSEDSLHAGYILESDVFLTADRRFFSVLETIKARHPKSARVRVIDRGASSALAEIKQALTK